MSRIARLVTSAKRAQKAPLAVARGGARIELFELTQRKQVRGRVEHDEERPINILSHFPERLQRAVKLQIGALAGATVPVLVQLGDHFHFARCVLAFGRVAL